MSKVECQYVLSENGLAKLQNIHECQQWYDMAVN